MKVWASMTYVEIKVERVLMGRFAITSRKFGSAR